LGLVFRHLRSSKDFLAGAVDPRHPRGAMVLARQYPFGTAMKVGSDTLRRCLASF